jgi:hypothetical protein
MECVFHKLHVGFRSVFSTRTLPPPPLYLQMRRQEHYDDYWRLASISLARLAITPSWASWSTSSPLSPFLVSRF